MRLARILLDLLVSTFFKEGEPLIFLVVKTLERWQGKKIVYKGWNSATGTLTIVASITKLTAQNTTGVAVCNVTLYAILKRVTDGATELGTTLQER